MVLVGRDEEVGEWARVRLKDIQTFGPLAAMGFIIDDELKGAAVFHNFRWPNIELSLVIEDPRVMTRTNINVTFGYPFLFQNVNRVTSLTTKSNRRVRKLMEGIGFKLEGKMRHGMPNKESIMIYGYTKDDYMKSKWRKYG